jgi:hypothetical protein
MNFNMSCVDDKMMYRFFLNPVLGRFPRVSASIRDNPACLTRSHNGNIFFSPPPFPSASGRETPAAQQTMKTTRCDGMVKRGWLLPAGWLRNFWKADCATTGAAEDMAVFERGLVYRKGLGRERERKREGGSVGKKNKSSHTQHTHTLLSPPQHCHLIAEGRKEGDCHSTQNERGLERICCPPEKPSLY